MNVIELTILCLLARKNPPRYTSEIIQASKMLKHHYAYILLNRMCEKGLVSKCFDDAKNQFNYKRPFYRITTDGKRKLLDFLQKLGLRLD